MEWRERRQYEKDVSDILPEDEDENAAYISLLESIREEGEAA